MNRLPVSRGVIVARLPWSAKGGKRCLAGQSHVDGPAGGPVIESGETCQEQVAACRPASGGGGGAGSSRLPPASVIPAEAGIQGWMLCVGRGREWRAGSSRLPPASVIPAEAGIQGWVLRVGRGAGGAGL
ncbi:MAG: hypothetical protein OXU40_08680 [Nitrospira sp.]|nr:hypothetical protein [Nitrospira sp.]